MKLFTGWVLAAGLVLAAAGAHAQVVAPVSDVGSPGLGGPGLSGPYAAMPPEAPRPGYGYGPTLLPSTEVYTVVREAGLSPLGIPHLRGFIYSIAVIDRSGNDGRLVIDARNGRILRLVSAHGMGDNFNDEPAVVYGAPGTLAPDDPSQDRAAAAPDDPACGEPHRAGAEGQAARRQARARTGAADTGAATNAAAGAISGSPTETV